MLQARGGRPRNAQLHAVILEATRELLAVSSYGELSMESIAAHAHVGKKTLYRRWPSKAPLVAEAVLDAYGRGGSFAAPDTGDIRADLRAWLVEHAEFIALSLLSKRHLHQIPGIAVDSRPPQPVDDDACTRPRRLRPDGR